MTLHFGKLVNRVNLLGPVRGGREGPAGISSAL